ncbi:hypothetical protein DFP72DRAFT_1081225 [Ephemerocybe angulata]|uniref:Uncharacterized protein n=1 Tax=Ephemerocybe angulata TaxID=980116 RepID=A0A8H6HB24_9AGAR|nr:hypothetical protein DFP72DRAFT_1081225 [Tulosesus angulatus]
MVGRRSIRSEDGARMGATAAFVSKERGAGCLALIATRHAQWGRSLERTIREVRRGDTGFRVREWAHSVRWAMVDMLGEARRGTDGTAGRGWTGVLGCGESDGDMMAKRPSGCQGVLSWWRWWAKVEPMEGGQRWDGRRQVGCGGDKAVVGDDGETPFGRQWSTLKEEYDEWRLEDEGGTTSAHSVHVREGATTHGYDDGAQSQGIMGGYRPVTSATGDTTLELRPFCQQTLELCFLTFNPPPTSARRTSIHTVFVTQHHRTQHALNCPQTTLDASTSWATTHPTHVHPRQREAHRFPEIDTSSRSHPGIFVFLTFTAQALTPDRNASGCQQGHPVFRNKIRRVKMILDSTDPQVGGTSRTLARRTDFCRGIAIPPHPSPIPFRSVASMHDTANTSIGTAVTRGKDFCRDLVILEYFECGRVHRRSRLLAHPLPINSTALAECEGALACFEVHSTTSQSHPSPRIHFCCYFVKETLTELTLAPPYRGSGKKSPFWVVRVPEVRRSANPKIPIVCVISTGVPESVQYHRFTIGFECALTPTAPWLNRKQDSDIVSRFKTLSPRPSELTVIISRSYVTLATTF